MPNHPPAKPTRAQIRFALLEAMPPHLVPPEPCALCKGADDDCEWCKQRKSQNAEV